MIVANLTILKRNDFPLHTVQIIAAFQHSIYKEPEAKIADQHIATSVKRGETTTLPRREQFFGRTSALHPLELLGRCAIPCTIRETRSLKVSDLSGGG